MLPIIACLALFASTPVCVSAVEYVLDPTLNLPIRSRSDVSFNRVRETSTGQILITGAIDYVDGVPQTRFARINADGSLDPNWTVPDTNGVITQFESGADGRLFIAGNFTEVEGIARPGLARLNADGSVDLGFEPLAGLQQPFRDVIALPDGGCYIFEGLGSNTRVRRLDASGQLSLAHTPITVSSVMNNVWPVGPEGQLAFVRANQSGPSGVLAFDSSGTPSSLPAAIPVNFRSFGVAFDASGALVISGQTSPGFGPALIRIQANGQLDAGFSGFSPLPTNFGGSEITRLSDGTFVTIAGGVGNTFPPPHLMRYSSTGAYLGGHTLGNDSEGYPANLSLHALANGDFLVSGRFTTVDGIVAPMLARLSSSGELRQDFFADLLGRGRVRAVVPFGTDSQLVGGNFTETGDAQVGNLVEVNSDDSLNDSLPYVAFGVQRAFATADGGAVIFGGFGTQLGTTPTGVAKIQNDGQVDIAFLSAVTISGFRTGLGLPDGSVILAGNFGQSSGPVPPAASVLTRIRPDGAIDPSFFNHSTLGGSPQGIVGVGADSAGRILVAGPFTSFQGVPRAGLARTSPDGVIDLSFVPDVAITTQLPQRIHVLPDGRFYVIGSRVPVVPPISSGLLRFHSDGSIDDSFVLPVVGNVSDVLVHPDGSLFVAINAPGDASYVIRLLPNDELDASSFFVMESMVQALSVDDQGRVLVGGAFTTVNGERRELLARFAPAVFSVSIEGDDEHLVPLLSDLTLTANVTAAPASPTYTWYRDGKVIPGATGPSLSLNHIVPKHEGDYTVTATAEGESVTSEPVTVTVRRGNPFR